MIHPNYNTAVYHLLMDPQAVYCRHAMLATWLTVSTWSIYVIINKSGQPGRKKRLKKYRHLE
jgi:hypothetical protein